MNAPRPSSTVVVLRDSDRGPELLLVKRRSGDAFGDAYTFPGGVLDDDEYLARELCSGLDAEEANSLLGMKEGGLDLFNAAVRELFEETGVLLAQGDLEQIKEFRQELNDVNVTWPDLLRTHRLTIDCGSLHYFAHWITPTGLPKRWSTRFFLAEMPGGQKAVPDGREVTDSSWSTANEALDGGLNLPYPTRRTIESLAGLDSVEDLFGWARKRQERGIPAIQPVLLTKDGKRRIMMPDVAD
jgi:8-oxo-dGTP pyrophosphatase MutT (NUDIX family)